MYLLIYVHEGNPSIHCQATCLFRPFSRQIRSGLNQSRLSWKCNCFCIKVIFYIICEIEWMVCDMFVTWVKFILFVSWKYFYTWRKRPVKVYHCANDWGGCGTLSQQEWHSTCQSTHHFYITDTVKFDGYGDTLMWHVNKPEQFATLLKTQEEKVNDILWCTQMILWRRAIVIVIVLWIPDIVE